MIITFEPLSHTHFAKLLCWLESPHVKKWWDQNVVYTIELVHEKYSSYVDGYKLVNGKKKLIEAFIIKYNQRPVGYIQIYNPHHFHSAIELAGFPTNVGALDIFIGEEEILHQGIGSKTVLEFLKIYGQQYPHILVEAHSHNIAAIKCYEKAGFLKVAESENTRHVSLLKSRDIIESAIAHELIQKHDCIAIILYGSRALGDFSAKSDYDIFGITKSSKEEKLARFDESFQVYYDIFLHPETELYPIKEEQLRLKDGFCLYDTNNIGAFFLSTIRKEANKPIESSETDSNALKVWHLKMASRASLNDLEGKYRRIWLIYALLEDYFTLRKIRYEGPKVAFNYLKQHDIIVYNLFEALLDDHKNEELLNALIAHTAKSSVKS